MCGANHNKKLIKEYKNDVLNNLAILEEHNVSYKNIVLHKFRTHQDNGKICKHSEREIYAIAIFCAIVESDKSNIIEFLKTPNLIFDDLKFFIENLMLTKYISGNSRTYKTWKSGDVGVAHLVFDEEKGLSKIGGFANQSLLKRREFSNNKTKDSKEDFTFGSFQMEDSFKPFENKNYNDQLDLDQQDPEFWDS